MEKLATEESVWSVCERFSGEGRKITGRAVLAEVGGSLSTVLKYIDSWKKRSLSDSSAPEIPSYLQESLKQAINAAAKEEMQVLRIQLEESGAREIEVLDALEKYEVQIAVLSKDLGDAIEKGSETRQVAERDAAVAAEMVSGLRAQIVKLEQESDHLIRAGESSRIEAAKAQLQVERADQATVKADERVKMLEAQVAELATKNTDAEKGQAVAEQHANDLVEQVAKLIAGLGKSEEKISALESEKTTLTRDFNSAEAARRKAEGVGEQMDIRLQDYIVTVEQLRKELETIRKSQI